MTMMKLAKTLGTVLFTTAMLAALPACQKQEGPAERAGKAVDKAVEQAGEKVDVLAGRADKLLSRLEAGDGTLGALMKDKQAYDDLKSLLADLRKNPWKMLWKD